MPKRILSPEILSVALEALESQRDRIVTQIAEIRRSLGAAPTAGTPGSTSFAQRPKRKMSAAARKRIAEAQRKRWQAFKKASESARGTTGKQTAKTAKAAPPRKRKMSAAGRKRIIEAAKRRWAEFRKKAKKSVAGPQSA